MDVTIGETLDQTLKVREVDGVEILSLVDNSVDFLSTIDRDGVQSFRQWTKERHGEEWIRTHSQLPLAEHGFSMLIRVLSGGKSTMFCLTLVAVPKVLL